MHDKFTSSVPSLLTGYRLGKSLAEDFVTLSVHECAHSLSSFIVLDTFMSMC